MATTQTDKLPSDFPDKPISPEEIIRYQLTSQMPFMKQRIRDKLEQRDKRSDYPVVFSLPAPDISHMPYAKNMKKEDDPVHRFYAIGNGMCLKIAEDENWKITYLHDKAEQMQHWFFESDVDGATAIDFSEAPIFSMDEQKADGIGSID